ncbi:MAG: hypothetical protein JOZ11_09590 [Alphaproteobacteria bacterium]|nr:hypothetical protein [Alphaproteobacteria bacterium]
MTTVGVMRGAPVRRRVTSFIVLIETCGQRMSPTAAPTHDEPGLLLHLFSQTDLIFKRMTAETRTSGHREGSEPSHREVDGIADKCPRRLR